MSEEALFAAVFRLSGSSALAWAADCVEHLAEQFGDTEKDGVGASVAFARKYSQDRTYDAETARALAHNIRHARRKLRAGDDDSFGSVMFKAALSAVASIFLPMLESPGTDRDGERGFGFSGRERQVKYQRAALLRGAQALCGADPHVAARDAAAHCRRGGPEAMWQLERLTAYQQAPSNPVHTGA